jgi:hypothetical protein
MTHVISVTPLDEGSARLRDFYLTRHNTQKKETSGFEPAIRTRERSQTYALDRAGFMIGQHLFVYFFFLSVGLLTGYSNRLLVN